MTRPASSFLGMARVSLMTRRAKVLVRAFSSAGFIRRHYEPTGQSAIGNRQSGDDLRPLPNPLAAAGLPAAARRVFLVGVARAAAVDDAIHSGPPAARLGFRFVADATESAVRFAD